MHVRLYQLVPPFPALQAELFVPLGKTIHIDGLTPEWYDVRFRNLDFGMCHKTKPFEIVEAKPGKESHEPLHVPIATYRTEEVSP